ncbi:TIGR04104 family putative zinc finger protein [Lentibacillus amyloliquefaciens]|uniref:TIGR04104 family putative zinc finger protein n=1 Tax=Lentibacillus amyloliquefaciens TaxID=1472767 RepID=UPI0009E9DE50
MPKCKFCNRHLEWNRVYTSLWFPDKVIICSECGTNHNISSHTHRYISLSIIIPMLLLGLVLNNLLSFSFTINLIVCIVLMLFLGILISLFIPYFIKPKKSNLA